MCARACACVFVCVCVCARVCVCVCVPTEQSATYFKRDVLVAENAARGRQRRNRGPGSGRRGAHRAARTEAAQTATEEKLAKLAQRKWAWCTPETSTRDCKVITSSSAHDTAALKPHVWCIGATNEWSNSPETRTRVWKLRTRDPAWVAFVGRPWVIRRTAALIACGHVSRDASSVNAPHTDLPVAVCGVFRRSAGGTPSSDGDDGVTGVWEAQRRL